MWTDVGEGVNGGSIEGFLDALAIWINKPHVINRRLCGSCTLYEKSTRTLCSLDECCVSLRGNAGQFSEVDKIDELLLGHPFMDNSASGDMDYHGPTEVESSDIEVVVRDLHPKLLDKFCTQREVIIIDRYKAMAIFIPVLLVSPNGETSLCHQPAYRVVFVDNEIRISVTEALEAEGFPSDQIVENGATLWEGEPPKATVSHSEQSGLRSGASCRGDWLRDHLLKKVGQWSFHQDLNTNVTSLRHVPLDRYNQRYNDMKSKYGPHLVQNWPESTDPQKFVFEDIAIAAYLLLPQDCCQMYCPHSICDSSFQPNLTTEEGTLWELEREELGTTKPQSFVDLGCGNGLLVHLLAEEGHPGKGIDLRKRSIWEGFYGEKTFLEELTLIPSEKSLFKGYDWLIGNHSDELTPWIPVMAARSSYNCRYFVLPCCSWDFDSRFREKAHGKSQYRCYLDFVRLVGETCRFNVAEDTLRIPSTKRVCFIGKSRTYPASEESSIDEARKDFIASRCSLQTAVPSGGYQGDTTVWASDFKARCNIEKPRNCVLLSNELKCHVVNKVFRTILETDGGQVTTTEDGRSWNTGGCLPLSEAATLFESSVMKELKNECGGLQTLLRNHYHVFRVQAGCVYIRDMGAEDEAHWARKTKSKGNQKSNKDLRKTRMCYLNQNHPDGCPKPSNLCRFAHGESDLRVVGTTEDTHRL